MLRRFWSRKPKDVAASYRAAPLDVRPGEQSNDRLELTVSNPDAAEDARLVLRVARTSTDEHTREEQMLGTIEPGAGSSVVLGAEPGDVHRIWWFLSWSARGTAQLASGSVPVRRGRAVGPHRE